MSSVVRLSVSAVDGGQLAPLGLGRLRLQGGRLDLVAAGGLQHARSRALSGIVLMASSLSPRVASAQRHRAAGSIGNSTGVRGRGLVSNRGGVAGVTSTLRPRGTTNSGGWLSLASGFSSRFVFFGDRCSTRAMSIPFSTSFSAAGSLVISTLVSSSLQLERLAAQAVALDLGDDAEVVVRLDLLGQAQVDDFEARLRPGRADADGQDRDLVGGGLAAISSRISDEPRLLRPSLKMTMPWTWFFSSRLRASVTDWYRLVPAARPPSPSRFFAAGSPTVWRL